VPVISVPESSRSAAKKSPSVKSQPEKSHTTGTSKISVCPVEHFGVFATVCCTNQHSGTVILQMHQSACRIWQCYREDTVSPSFFFLLLLLLFASRVVVRTCKMERTLAQASKPVHAPKRFAVIVLPVARNEESDSQTNGTAGSLNDRWIVSN